MIAYASRTGTKRNLDALRAAGFGLLVSARGVLRTEGFSLYALDNGAWTAFQRQEAFDVRAFEFALEKLGRDAQFVVAPDIVGGGIASLRLSESWLPKLVSFGVRRLIAVQDGQTEADVSPLIGDAVGIFVGGSTEWKLATLPAWARLARARGAYLHVARVNSARRIRACAMAGADSFDGTSATRFASTVRALDLACRQLAMELLG